MISETSDVVGRSYFIVVLGLNGFGRLFKKGI